MYRIKHCHSGNSGSLARVSCHAIMLGIDQVNLTFALSTIISVNSLLFISFQRTVKTQAKKLSQQL